MLVVCFDKMLVLRKGLGGAQIKNTWPVPKLHTNINRSRKSNNYGCGYYYARLERHRRIKSFIYISKHQSGQLCEDLVWKVECQHRTANSE